MSVSQAGLGGRGAVERPSPLVPQHGSVTEFDARAVVVSRLLDQLSADHGLPDEVRINVERSTHLLELLRSDAHHTCSRWRQQQDVLEDLRAQLARFEAVAQRKLALAVKQERARCADELDAAVHAESLASIEKDRVAARLLAVQRSCTALSESHGRSGAEKEMVKRKAEKESTDGKEALRVANVAASARETAEADFAAAEAAHQETLRSTADDREAATQLVSHAESRLDAARRLLAEEQAHGPPEDVSADIQGEIRTEIAEQEALRAAISAAEAAKAAAAEELSAAQAELRSAAQNHHAASVAYKTAVAEASESLQAISDERNAAEEQLVREREVMDELQLTASAAQDVVFKMRKEIEKHQEIIDAADRAKPQRAAEMERIGEQLKTTQAEYDKLYRSTNALRATIEEKQTAYGFDEKVAKEDREVAVKALAEETELKEAREQDVRGSTAELASLRDTANLDIAAGTAGLEQALESESCLLKMQAELQAEQNDLHAVRGELEEQLAAVEAVVARLVDEFLPQKASLDQAVTNLEAETGQLQTTVTEAPEVMRNLETCIVKTQDRRSKIAADSARSEDASHRLANDIKVTRVAIDKVLSENRFAAEQTAQATEDMSESKKAVKHHVAQQAAGVAQTKAAISALFRNNPASAADYRQVHAEMAEKQRLLAAQLQQRSLLESEAVGLRGLIPREEWLVSVTDAHRSAERLAGAGSEAKPPLADAPSVLDHVDGLLAKLECEASRIRVSLQPIAAAR